jgi:hypothetical protein
MACPSPEVSTNVTNFYSGGSVSVVVTCVARLSDVAAPGIPGSRTLSASSTAPMDPYTVGGTAASGTLDSAQRTGGAS